MRRSLHVVLTLLVAVIGASAQTAPPSSPPPPTAPDAQERQQLMQQMQQIRQRLQQLGGSAEGALRPSPPAPYTCEPVNPNATPEARELLKNLCAISGKYTLSGQHNFPADGSKHSDKAAQEIGRYPALWGSDFGFTGADDKDSTTHRQEMIDEAKKQAAEGSVITLCWHMLRPTEDEPGTPGESWRGSVQAHLTDEQWAELITPDTPLHKRWEHYMDTAAGYLQQLQDAHIPVLFRPMHENNGTFFWWGGRPGMGGTAELYREVYTRMVNVHHLNNLLWVWNQNGPAPTGQFIDFFPGQQYVDIVSYDNYSYLADRYYYELLDLAQGKPIALGEVGQYFDRDVLIAQPKWVYFMHWAGDLNEHSACMPFESLEQCQTRNDRMKALYNDPHVLWRGELAVKANQ